VVLDGKTVRKRTIYLRRGHHTVDFINEQESCTLKQGFCRIIYDFQANKKSP